MLFDWLVVGHVLDVNPAHAVRGPKYSQKKGRTPVLDREEARALLAAIDTGSLIAGGVQSGIEPAFVAKREGRRRRKTGSIEPSVQPRLRRAGDRRVAPSDHIRPRIATEGIGQV